MRRCAIQDLRLSEWTRPGDVIAWPQGPGEPLALTRALLDQADSLPDRGLLFGLTASDTLRPGLSRRFALHALNGAGGSRRATADAECYPLHVSALPALLRGGALPLDVLLIQVTPLPDGRYSLGVIADFTAAMIARARVVIALLNPALPALGEDAAVAADDIDLLVERDERLVEMPEPRPSAVEDAVAAQVAALVPDRATLQLGVGTLPAAVARALMGHRELGVHSGVVSDALVDLVEAGVVSNAHKGRDAGRSVTGGLFGTARLRRFAAASGLVSMRGAEYTHALAVTASLHALHSINSAIEIDLSGQVNAEVAGGRYLGAVGGQVDFVRAGMASPGGKSILAFPSTTPDGARSRIVARLSGPVTTARSDVDVVVTEYGAAHLRGVGLRQRRARLLAIAHPAFRDGLRQAFGEEPV
ncbi:acetyl-CoA hydrolase/transferase family protein [Bordetella hinzii]|uniref:acetyl-CoA hydrolase/transferase family protein n=1 Tax=Bordetella hinzii TaxID=103855 RepID=UPI00041E1FA7|nr:acetyl-CoA hydrolase/transferase C-terminal domain-containing protein [Bordetella hinzii]AKQ57062.1 Succinyl-CoA:coenzyme A transferase [Bordetella hinzii]KCB32168.1 putative 4-hydroxybutyrate coenzyme A transferase [Bordetella hinzii L60]KCB50070.1 putative 4-hydroxybutyrate coenzyme A transferase [Bordetella hinzii 1277]SNV66723.1 acetyl-CoA hydrolase/transferase [Bordetella hinzii]